MGVCSSTKKRIVVRQSSSLKFPLQQQFSQQKKQNGTKFVKKESDLNLVPAEMQKNCKIVSDESIFEREKRMAVILVSCQPEKASQLVLVDVDFQSVSFGKVICRLSLPLPGEELFSLGCMRNTHSGIHQEELDHLLEKQQMNQQFTLIAPVPSHSRIYVFNLMDGTIGNDNGSISKGGVAPADGALLTQIRIQKCINREELSRWDLGAPLSVCSNNAGRSSAIPLLIVTNVDRGGHSKGDLLRLDRRTFCPVDRRKRSITEEDRESSVNSGMTTFSNSPTKSQCAISTPPGQPPKFPFFGGALAINVRNGVVFSTEWGNLEQIFKEKPNLKQNLGSQDLLDNGGPSTTYGCSLNVWDIRKRRLIQTIRLDPEDGLWPICIRMVHNPELSHGFLCTALGGCIFHVHKSTKSGTWVADRLAKFSAVNVPMADWAGSSTEIPAFLVDMAISMDDNNLFVSANFHGFVAQMDISDPFRPSLIQKVFLGGIVYKCMGFTGLGKMPKANTMSISYNTEEIKLNGRTFEGGPCRLQLSLDGRRLFISNSLLRNWDQHFFPQLTECGSSIALVHVDPTGMKPMRIDEEFGIHFDDENADGRIASENQKKSEFKSPFYAREMRFLGGDSTADFI